jgi:hypothetical protein
MRCPKKIIQKILVSNTKSFSFDIRLANWLIKLFGRHYVNPNFETWQKQKKLQTWQMVTAKS